MTELTNERADFEAWGRANCGMTDESLERRKSGHYAWGRTCDMWEAWQAARRATPSSEYALPPLPEPERHNFGVYAYTAEQVEQIRREAVEADRRARSNSPEFDGIKTQPASAAQGVKMWRERVNLNEYHESAHAMASIKAADAEIVDLRAQLAAATENLKTAVQQAWTANAELSKLRAQLARQSQDELAYFYRQRHTGLNWVETDRDPRALFAGTPMEVCMEYRTLYAAPPLPSKPQAEYREALEMCAKALEGFGIAKSARDFALQNARRVLDESQAEKGADACGS